VKTRQSGKEALFTFGWNQKIFFNAPRNSRHNNKLVKKSPMDDTVINHKHVHNAEQSHARGTDLKQATVT